MNHTVKASNTPGMRDAELNVSADGEIVECEWVVDGKKLPDSGPKVTVPLKPGKHDVGVNVKYKNKDGKESKASVVKPIDVPASNAPLSAKLDGPGVCKLAEPCTFIVLTDKAWGTGFAMTPDGYILTNKHVIGDADKVWIAHRSWGDQPVPAEVVKLSPNKDLALLKVPKKFTSYLHPAGTPEKGTTVYAVGYPGTGIERPKDFPPSPQIDRGDISHNDRELDGVSCLQTNAPVNPGNSGGPLLDETGHVVGVVTFAMKGLQGTNGAIKIQEALKEFPQLTR